MKTIITLLAVLFSLTANAQLQRRFSIDPYVVQQTIITPSSTVIQSSDTATQAALYINGSNKDSSSVYFVLYKSDSVSVVRYVVKTVSNNAAAVLLVFPINLANLNNFIMGQIDVDALSEY